MTTDRRHAAAIRQFRDAKLRFTVTELSFRAVGVLPALRRFLTDAGLRASARTADSAGILDGARAMPVRVAALAVARVAHRAAAADAFVRNLARAVAIEIAAGVVCLVTDGALAHGRRDRLTARA